MKRMIVAGGVALATLWGAGDAGAVQPSDFEFRTADNLYRVCAAPETDPLFAEARQACYAFAFGAGLVYIEAVRAGKAKEVVCPGANIDREAVRVAFVEWAKAHPDKLAESPIDGLFRSAAARWPCRK
jgi:hypothetical protein